jgi:CubicO group peptidase (beta-lactamase class C family)
MSDPAGELPTAAPEEVGMSSERLARIGQKMQQSIASGRIQGAVTAVARRGKVVHFETHGQMDVEAARPMEKDAIFRMASSTKPILGVAAMMMIEEGLIRPSNKVTRFLPEFNDTQVAVLEEPTDEDISPRVVQSEKIPPHRLVPAERPITIEHLLTHTSGLLSMGLGSAISGMRPRGPDVTLASYIPTLGEVPLDFQPGTRWTYSPGAGLDVVARIIEIVSETPFDEFIRTRIFEPLGMTDTYFNVPAEKEAKRVVIHGRDMSAWNRGPTQYFSASGGLSSTAEDFLRFEQMFAHGGQLFGNRLLSPRSIEVMAANHVGDLFAGVAGGQSGMGFGYTVSMVLDPIAADSRRSAGAFGWGGAFGTQSWTDPRDALTAVLMLQQPHLSTQYDFDNAVRQAITD